MSRPKVIPSADALTDLPSVSRLDFLPTSMTRQQRCTCTHFTRAVKVSHWREDEGKDLKRRMIRHLQVLPIFAYHARWWSMARFRVLIPFASKQSSDSIHDKARRNRLAKLLHINLNSTRFFYTRSLPYENIDWNKLIVIVDEILIDML